MLIYFYSNGQVDIFNKQNTEEPLQIKF